MIEITDRQAVLAKLESAHDELAKAYLLIRMERGTPQAQAVADAYLKTKDAVAYVKKG